jgi:hypothetical protein
LSETTSTPEFPALARELIETFGDGWARQNSDQLLTVFTENAVFREGPFGKPLEGIENIRTYWGDISYHQSEGTFTAGEIFTVGPWFSVEFKCVFRRRRTGEWVDVRGTLFCETEEEKISEMRMYWHRWTRGQEVGNSP